MAMPLEDEDTRLPQIRQKANWMRRRALEMVHGKKLGHIGGDFSATDILATLYFGVLRYDPVKPDWPERDRFVMSKGHATGALYTVLCAAGYFPEDWLKTYMGPGSRLNGHPNRNYLPGVEANTGPLGHGFPIALGMAIAGQMSGSAHRTFVLTGDGEQQEGSNWEAAMTAGHKQLQDLTLIIDRNRLQQGARTEDTVSLDPLGEKYRSFGWDVIEVDGHDHAKLLNTLDAAPAQGRPRCIIANTIKGKGVSFMEDKAKWHHGVPNDDEFELAMKELSR
ncbi:Transketolase, subunit I [Hoeflea phototrophica DFL-43]|uniref:Transketolase, subunit I n=1 Tax=Hoeflea phototrophica (strain DSM 17068 / NCIMB 14078 / DFL-43) TaxID=411684 RepID=A9CVE0_HOEPD|nr:transketolase [Hoeflea phototrophica]EDQ35362.1 Transketolase, subunit I [Hoeflea phototrophica DFL-43]